MKIDGHGAALSAAACAVTTKSDAAAESEAGLGSAICELEDVECAAESQVRDGGLSEQVFLVLRRERATLLNAETTPIQGIRPGDVAAREGPPCLRDKGTIGDVNDHMCGRLALFLNHTVRR